MILVLVVGKPQAINARVVNAAGRVLAPRMAAIIAVGQRGEAVGEDDTDHHEVGEARVRRGRGPVVGHEIGLGHLVEREAALFGPALAALTPIGSRGIAIPTSSRRSPKRGRGDPL